MTRHLLSLFISSALHLGIALLIFWQWAMLTPQQENHGTEQLGAIAFNFGKLIQTAQISSRLDKQDQPASISQKAQQKQEEVVKEVEKIQPQEPEPLVQAVEKVQEIAQPAPKKIKPKPKVTKEQKIVKKEPKKTADKPQKPQQPSPPSQARDASNTLSNRVSQTPSGHSRGTIANSNQQASSAKIDSYRVGLQRAINQSVQKSYPAMAKRQKRQGTVVVSFNLADNGRLFEVRVKSSSGYAELDRAAVKALERLGSYQAPPADFPRSLTIPIEFRLR